MDFFIVYNKADKQWADWIGYILEEKNYTVWIPDWDIHSGNNMVIEIQNVLNDILAMKDKRRMILIVSPNLSNNTIEEISWTSVLTHDPDGSKGLLLPVVVDNNMTQQFLSEKKCIVLTQDESEDSFKSKLLEGISRQRHKPPCRPQWPGSKKSQYFLAGSWMHNP